MFQALGARLVVSTRPRNRPPARWGLQAPRSVCVLARPALLLIHTHSSYTQPSPFRQMCTSAHHRSQQGHVTMSPVACWGHTAPKPVRSPSRDDLPQMSRLSQPEDRCPVCQVHSWSCHWRLPRLPRPCPIGLPLASFSSCAGCWLRDSVMVGTLARDTEQGPAHIQILFKNSNQ